MKATIKVITPEEARILLSNNKNNRPLRQKTVLQYAAQMKKGAWMLNGQGISLSKTGNILDGQHRLSAIISSECSIEMLVIEDVEDDTFTTYDVGKNRSTSDMFAIEGIPNSVHVSTSIGKYFSLSSNYAYDGSSIAKQAGITMRDKLNKYYENPSLWDELNSFSRTCIREGRYYSRAEVAGFMYHLIVDKDKLKAVVYDFFNQLFEVGNLRATNSAILALRKRLMRDIMKGEKKKPKQKIALLKKAWNYYITGKSVSHFKYNPGVDDKINLR